jgi:hypothetical protein
MDPMERVAKCGDIEERAMKLANRGGRRPANETSTALLISGGVYVLLEVFADVILPDLEEVFWLNIIFTAVCGNGFLVVQKIRRKAWDARFVQTLAQLHSLTYGGGTRWR